ncbi:MAG TPA: hydrogenase maturation protease [Tepidisphaeraceae bacterium]
METQPLPSDAVSADAAAALAAVPAPARVLIAGIGNIFLGDDAFGVEVAQRLLRRAWPTGVCVVEFGIRGIDLTYALLEGWDAVVLVDAAPRGFAPGTVYTIEPDVGDALAADAAAPVGMPMIEPHSLDPARVLRLVGSMGGRVGRLVLVACEPTPVDDPDGQDIRDGLSPPVRGAVDQAVTVVERLAAQFFESHPIIPRPPEGAGPECKELHHGTVC